MANLLKEIKEKALVLDLEKDLDEEMSKLEPIKEELEEEPDAQYNKIEKMKVHAYVEEQAVTDLEATELEPKSDLARIELDEATLIKEREIRM